MGVKKVISIAKIQKRPRWEKVSLKLSWERLHQRRQREQRSPATKAQSNYLLQNKNVNSEIDEYQTNILNSEIVNETTIVAWYDPSVVTSDLLGCGLKKENESPSGSYAICHKHINVGCKYNFNLNEIDQKSLFIKHYQTSAEMI